MTEFPWCQVPLTDQRDQPSWSPKTGTYYFSTVERRKRKDTFCDISRLFSLFIYILLDVCSRSIEEHEKLLAMLCSACPHVYPLFCTTKIGISCSGQARCNQSIASDLCTWPFSPFCGPFSFFNEPEETLCPRECSSQRSSSENLKCCLRERAFQSRIYMISIGLVLNENVWTVRECLFNCYLCLFWGSCNVLLVTMYHDDRNVFYHYLSVKWYDTHNQSYQN